MQKTVGIILLITIGILYFFLLKSNQKTSVSFSEKVDTHIQTIPVSPIDPDKGVAFVGKSFFAANGKFHLLYPSECFLVNTVESPNYLNPTIDCRKTSGSFILIPQAGGHSAAVSKRDILKIGPIIWNRSVFTYENKPRESYGFLYQPNQTYYVVEIVYNFYTPGAVGQVQNILSTFTPISSS